MRLSRLLTLLTVITATFYSCSDDDETVSSTLDSDLTAALIDASDGQGIDFFQLPASDDFAAIPQDDQNPLSEEKVALGQLLFHETGLAQFARNPDFNDTYSCASCHVAEKGFQANRQQGIADGGVGFSSDGLGRIKNPLYEEVDMDVQPIRPPTILNLTYQELVLWNGSLGGVGDNLGTEAQWTPGTPLANNHLGFKGAETQAVAGLVVHRMWSEDDNDPINDLLNTETYTQLYADAFPNEAISRITTGKAIAAYGRTVLTNEAPFQQWLDGDTQALTDSQKRGALLFFGKANCVSCHTGPALNSMTFHALGMNDLSDRADVFLAPDDSEANLGRGGFTTNAEDNYKFKTPQLYNLRGLTFFGHGSSFSSIREVIEYKNAGVAQNIDVPSSQLASAFTPLGLTDAEVDDLVAFVSDGLHDANLVRYKPSAVPSGNCFPANDETSKIDLGCAN